MVLAKLEFVYNSAKPLGFFKYNTGGALNIVPVLRKESCDKILPVKDAKKRLLRGQ
jgi:hypothetical protein